MIRLLTPALLVVSVLHAAEPFELKLETITKGYDGTMCWVHPRAGAIPGNPPQVVLTMQKLLLDALTVLDPQWPAADYDVEEQKKLIADALVNPPGVDPGIE